MTQAEDDAVAEAVALAHSIADRLGAVVLTEYPDADTLDLMHPGAPPLETVAAINRAVAAALAEHGVAVLVQRAGRGAFRRWMEGRDDTPATRRAWRDRAGLLQGDAAMAALGLPPAPPPPRDRAAGTPADRLMRAFADEDGSAFDRLAEELVAAGRDGVLEQAMRKVAQRYGEDAAGDLARDLQVVAEGARLGPSGWAELVALPVALPPGAVPDAVSLGHSLVASGALPEGLELRFLPEWRNPAALEALAPGAVRRVLLDLLAGREPADLPVAAEAALSEAGFGALVGLQLDWDTPGWEQIVADGLPEPPAEDAPETPEQAASSAVFERWRAKAFEAGDCVPLALVPFSETADEIEDFLEEAGEQTGGLQEIRDFVDMARQEAPEAEVVCRAEVLPAALRLTVLTRAGQVLDSLELPAERLPAPPAEMPALIAGFVPLLPGG
ncbi:hypothetical protein [Roseomonas haemaphysalidis]|uniref:Uncharacterized protein n=1 Tax=Roseomonas haemaphysalidis TaxID=2768162 RepID=A0ABS3KT70_9PROT|nr:hypothetical protein [Roseomonas haemaphysalidis]MBO1080656.1 hypothetical protein [Roseomonas haemaphysalidis]